MKTIKILWCVSVLVVFLFFMSFEGYRIFDYVSGDYTVQKMTITDSSYESTPKRKSVMINGNINGEKVYFSRFDEHISELYNLYPFLSSNNKNTSVIEVLKFKHSHKVMLLNDDEFTQWKKHLLMSSLYVGFSIMFFLFNYLKMKK
jgi:hypothetical protein